MNVVPLITDKQQHLFLVSLLPSTQQNEVKWRGECMIEISGKYGTEFVVFGV